MAKNHKKCFTPSFALFLFKILQKTTVLVSNVEHCSGFDMLSYHFFIPPPSLSCEIKNSEYSLSQSHTKIDELICYWAFLETLNPWALVANLAMGWPLGITKLGWALVPNRQGW